MSVTFNLGTYMTHYACVTPAVRLRNVHTHKQYKVPIYRHKRSHRYHTRPRRPTTKTDDDFVVLAPGCRQRAAPSARVVIIRVSLAHVQTNKTRRRFERGRFCRKNGNSKTIFIARDRWISDRLPHDDGKSKKKKS